MACRRGGWLTAYCIERPQPPSNNSYLPHAPARSAAAQRACDCRPTCVAVSWRTVRPCALRLGLWTPCPMLERLNLVSYSQPRRACVRLRTKSLGTNLCHRCSRPKPCPSSIRFFACDANSWEGYTILSASCRDMSYPHRERCGSGHVCEGARLVSGRMLPHEGLCTC